MLDTDVFVRYSSSLDLLNSIISSLDYPSFQRSATQFHLTVVILLSAPGSPDIRHISWFQILSRKETPRIACSIVLCSNRIAWTVLLVIVRANVLWIIIKSSFVLYFFRYYFWLVIFVWSIVSTFLSRMISVLCHSIVLLLPASTYWRVSQVPAVIFSLHFWSIHHYIITSKVTYYSSSLWKSFGVISGISSFRYSR